MSPVFAAMFASGMAEAESRRLVIEDADYTPVVSMYEYYGKVDDKPEVGTVVN